MRGAFHRLLSAGVDHKLIVIALLATISLFAGIGHYDENVLLDRFREGHSEIEEDESDKNEESDSGDRRPTVNPLRLDGADAIFVVESEDFFTQESVEALRAVTEELQSLEQVGGVLWIDRMPPLNIFGLLQPLLPRPRAPDAVFENAREKALAHPLVGGQLLSRDTKTMIILIYFDWRYVLNNADATTDLTDAAVRVAKEYPGNDFRFRVTGSIPGAVASIEHHESNSLRFQLVGYALSLILALILFRGIRAVIVVTLAPIFAVFWSTGIIQYLGYERNGLVTVVVPILVSLVALTDSVHLVVQVRSLRSEGKGKKEASRAAVQKVGLACFLTSLTTAIGFGSLIFADARIVQEFGKSAVVGVILSFVAVVTLIPLVSTTWLGQKIHAGHEKGFVDRNLLKISPLIDAVMKRPTLFSVLGIFLTLALGIATLQLKPDFRIQNAMPEKSEAAEAMAHLDLVFNGIEFVEATAKWNDEVSDDSPEILEVVTKIDDLLKQEELVGQPLSIRNMIDALPGTGPPRERMPMIELLPPPIKRAFYNPEKQEATVQFRVRDLGIAIYGPVYERLAESLAQINLEHPNFELGLRGSAIDRWENIYQIVVDLFRSLGFAIIVIFVVLTFVYRSLRIGLISLVPNLFPLAVAGVWLVLSGHNLEIVMVCNFTVCLGIAVDDTIHFLTRYQQEQRLTRDHETAIRRAFIGVGTALIMTTVVLVSGFSGVLLSDSRNHQIFGMMGIITIAMALFADLVFLPALLKRFAKPAKEKRFERTSLDSIQQG
ncbi:MAG: efflux RND transporter permease subunit [Verrucomicrobiota bacterium]